MHWLYVGVRWGVMPRSPAAAVAVLVVLVGCGGSSGMQPNPSATGSPTPSVSAMSPPTDAVSSDSPICEHLGYPCGLADTPPELVERTRELLDEARARRHAGSMDDLLAFFRTQPDVVEAFGSDDAIVFRVEGAPEAWFYDRTRFRNGAAADAQFATYITRRSPDPDVVADVVGEDTNADGVIDNADAKRALVLAPYLWQFAPNDESPHIKERLDSLPAYAGNVQFVANATKSDRNVLTDHYLSFDQYDAIFLATHAGRECGDLSSGQHICRVSVATGIRLNTLDVGYSGFGRGWILAGHYDGTQTLATPELNITPDWFRLNHPGGLTNTLFALSACESGNAEGNELALAAGGENFVMTAWSEQVNSDSAANAISLFVEQLALGLTSLEAYREVVSAGLHEALGPDGIPTVFQHISPGGDALRLFELPTLLHDGAPMTDQVDVSSLIVGTAGDGSPDRLSLTLQVTGVLDPDAFSVRYEIDGRPAAGTYSLAGAGAGEFRHTYVVAHDVEVGFDLPSEGFTLEAVVVLPEGGESRYAVTTRLCPTTPNGVVVPFDLPPGADYIGAHDYLPGDAWRVGSLDGAADFMRQAIAEAGYTIIDEPRASTVGDQEAFGLTVVGPCFESAASVTFTRSGEVPPTMVIWKPGG